MPNDENNSSEFGEIPEELKGKLKVGTYDSLLKEPDIASALKMLYDPGDEKETHKLMMRTDMPDSAFLFGMSRYISRCIFHKKDALKKEAYLILAGYPAIHKDKAFNNRTEQVVRAIIGEFEQRKQKPGQSQGFVETFKQKAGFGGDGV